MDDYDWGQLLKGSLIGLMVGLSLILIARGSV